MFPLEPSLAQVSVVYLVESIIPNFQSYQFQNLSFLIFLLMVVSISLVAALLIFQTIRVNKHGMHEVFCLSLELDVP